MIKFRHLPAVGKTIIITVAFGVFAVAGVACATSYNAIYRLVGMLGLYGGQITQVFPLMLDVAFIVAEMAAILGGIMRAVTRSEKVGKGWPYTTMVLCGALTIAFNVWHAVLIGGWEDPLTPPRAVVASLPPILMMVSFQVLIAIVKWVMLHLGRPLNSAAALSPTVPVGISYQQAPPPTPTLASASTPELDAASNGHGATMRERVEAYLAALTPEQLRNTSEGEVYAALRADGVTVSKPYVGRVLGQWRAARPDKRPSRG